MAGRIYFAMIGIDLANLAAVWHSAYGPRAKLGELERVHGAARLIWSMPGSPKVEAAVHAVISQYRVGDQNLFKMTADQVADLIDRIKGGARREAQELEAAAWIIRVAAAAAEELRALAREEDRQLDLRTPQEREEDERRAEEASHDAEAPDLEHADYIIARLFGWEKSLARLSPDYRPDDNPHRPSTTTPLKAKNEVAQDAAGDIAERTERALSAIEYFRERHGITSFRGLATALNAAGVRTKRHGRWHPTTVKVLLEKRGRWA
jgi:hypothetical protein